MPLQVLLVAAEAVPLAKTGGLADMVSAYAVALHAAGVETTILMPGYPDALATAAELVAVATLTGLPGGSARLLRGRMPDTGVPVILLQMDQLYDRAGLYQDEQGRDYPDNAVRFAALSAAAVRIAQGLPGLARPDLVHAHDWHAALTPLLLKLARTPVKSVFTIHNLAFQGNYALSMGPRLGIPQRLLVPALTHPGSIEFYGALSLMKAGILYADRVTSVSRTYSREILTPRFGHLMEGVLLSCANKLSGITNGIDTKTWNPATDPVLASRYSVADMRGKRACKRALQQMFGLPGDPFVPIVALASRLTGQKMADLAVLAMAHLLKAYPRLQIVVLGQGEALLEAAMVKLAQLWPDRVGVHIGYDERRAHMLHAGADILLHGSRFEPCGLAQLYAMRYGTIPVASRVGGLADTIVDVAHTDMDAGHAGERHSRRQERSGNVILEPSRAANGFLFDGETPQQIAGAVARALDAFMRPVTWRALQRNAMQGDYSWTRPTDHYLALYGELTRAAVAKTPIELRATATEHAPTAQPLVQISA